MLNQLRADARHMSRKANERLLAGFERALEEQRLHMVYQPKVGASRRRA